MKQSILPITIITLLATLWYGAWYWEAKKRSDWMKTEISEKDYHYLLMKSNYVKGSQQGKDLNNEIKKYFNDGFISKSEYKKLTGSTSELYFDNEPELKQLYRNAKAQLLASTRS